MQKRFKTSNKKKESIQNTHNLMHKNREMRNGKK